MTAYLRAPSSIGRLAKNCNGNMPVAANSCNHLGLRSFPKVSIEAKSKAMKRRTGCPWATHECIAAAVFFTFCGANHCMCVSQYLVLIKLILSRQAKEKAGCKSWLRRVGKMARVEFVLCTRPPLPSTAKREKTHGTQQH